MYTPSAVWTTKGTGSGETEIISFEYALRDAGAEAYNLVPVSSILPPDAEFVARDGAVERLSPGQVVHAVVSRDTVPADGSVDANAAIGVARPDKGHGYFIERNGVADAGDEAECLASEMVESSEATGGTVESFRVEATATPTDAEDTRDADDYTTAVALAVLLPPEGITGASF